MLVTIDKVSYTYPAGDKVLEEIDLEIAPGEMVALLGPNGAGKTTLLKLINRLLRPTRGSLHLGGRCLSSWDRVELCRRVGFLFQDPNDQLFAPTVWQDVAYGPQNLGLDKKEVEGRVSEALEQVQLQGLAQYPIHHLSWGQKKRAALAGLLAMKPELLLLDEPTAGLDPMGTSSLFHLLRDLNQKKNLTILMATHDVDLVPVYAHKVALLDGGRITAFGSPQEVFGQKDLVRRSNLRLPRVAHLFEILKNRGLNIPHEPLTIGEARRMLLPNPPASKRDDRVGYSTGACAAAAAAGAVSLLFTGRSPDEVTITLPKGEEARLPISWRKVEDGEARCGVRKDAGDDPDITHDATLMATARRLSTPGIIVKGGKGVGTVTKPGLQVPPGNPAINPVPLQMIRREVDRLLPPGAGVEVVISIPGGEELAQRTLNPKLGIKGGLSILGTSGLVRPMSEEAFKESLLPQLDIAQAQGFSSLVFTPGHLGETWARQQGFPADCLVQTSNFLGYMLQEAAKRKIHGVILCGHIGKLAKVAGGSFHTHNRVSDGRREVLAALAALKGGSPALVERILKAATAEEAAQIISEAGFHSLFTLLAQRVSSQAQEYLRQEMEVGTILFSLNGAPLAWEQGAVRIGGELGWQEPSTLSAWGREQGNL